MCERAASGHRRAPWLCRPRRPPVSPAVPEGGLGDVTRGDLDQPRKGAADQPGEPYPDHPETSPSEPALANDHVLREESAADSTGGDGSGGDSSGGDSTPSP